MAERVQELHRRSGKDWILVSGGTEGVCQVAETVHLALGGPVLSFRPVRLGDEEYAVEEWRIVPGGNGSFLVHKAPTFADFSSAAMYRSMLIAERAEHGDAFWNGHSQGTQAEIDFFEAVGKRLRVVRA